MHDVSDAVVCRPTSAAHQENEEILQVSGVQDWCEAEVCSEASLSTSLNTGLVAADVSHTPAPYADHEYTQDRLEPVHPVDAEVQTDHLPSNSKAFCSSTLNENDNISQRLQFIQIVLQTEKSLKRYTGIGSKTFLSGIFDMAESNIGNIYYWKGSKGNNVSEKTSTSKRKKKELTNFQEYLLTLVYIRQGFDLAVIADLFEISQTWAGIIVKSWINILAKVLNELLVYPSAATVRSYLPPDYPSEYADTRIILDCTEFFITTPGNTSSQAATFSSYKHHNTVKALIGVTPTGVITFVSKTFGGNTSDAHIFQSEFISRLEPGDAVMVDKGFNIADLALEYGAKLYIPPFTRNKSGGKGKTLNQNEIKTTRDIARLRVHVERAIRRIKEFKILSNRIDCKLFPLLDQILVIVAVLSNFGPPLVES
ncbi:hypothetical protein Pcinc_001169 [Petrolisthes cinctipes]|uniref:DDE Tnp4 domain-containing protein n=1 Tax=Petrolisthes cinctipes TaxID=88211 RepID=A0AAE1L3W3_PETCI|nr:hypothetical protein Pcinc_004201 [Petrolisthes cinctipes]KAK3895073.1 hypothetical protein Pcinc_001169 [Petrolisthes cinctipes]